MAEVAAGAGIALAAEQVLSTTVQVGAAGYYLAAPMRPLKATFTRVATAHDDEMKRRSLTRSHHTLTIVNNKAYIFGGTTSDGKVATNDIHVINLSIKKDNDHDPEYRLIPAIPSSVDGPVPGPRTMHAACAFDNKVAIYGGSNESTTIFDEDSCIWLFNPEDKTWTALKDESGPDHINPGNRFGAKLFHHGNTLLLYGGTTNDGRESSDLYRFDTATNKWHALPNPPALASPTNAALTNDHLYLISSSDAMSSELQMLHLTPKDNDVDNEGLKWETLSFPTNPIAPGPRARHGGALLPITTGYGRNYLIYLLGEREGAPTTSPTVPSPPASENPAPTQWSDTWTLQLPSSSLTPTPALSLSSALKPAHLKDVIRSGVGAESGTWAWTEVEVKVPDELGASEGKLHPGPRAGFGADVSRDGKRVVFWGGMDAEGERVGDGWVVGVE